MYMRFTLLELLATIMIIAVLAALLLPSVSRAGNRSKMIGCRSLLRQYALATSMYADDSDDIFPDIRKYLEPEYGFFRYLGASDIPDETLTRCPGDGTTENLGRIGICRINGKTIKTSIGGTVNLSDSSSATSGGKRFFIQSRKDPYLNSDPSKRCQWTDSQNRNSQTGCHAMSIGRGYGKESTYLAEYVFRHTGNTSNGAFCDGHVSHIKIAGGSLPVNMGHDIAGVWHFPGNCTWPYGPRQGPPDFPATKMQQGVSF